MSDSANESDYASAESDTSEPGTPKTESGATKLRSDGYATHKPEPTCSDQKSPDVEDTSPLENMSEISTQDVENVKTVEDTLKDSPEKGEGEAAITTARSGGSWGWGGWNSLLSSVTMVTESAQMLGQKVDCLQEPSVISTHDSIDFHTSMCSNVVR